MQLVAGKLGKSGMAKNAVVHAQVHVGEPKDKEGFGLEVDIKVENADEDLIRAGHEVRAAAHPIQTQYERGLGLPIQSRIETWDSRQRLQGVDGRSVYTVHGQSARRWWLHGGGPLASQPASTDELMSA